MIRDCPVCGRDSAEIGVCGEVDCPSLLRRENVTARLTEGAIPQKTGAIRRATIQALAPGYDPRHVEAFLRAEYGGDMDTLNTLEFSAAVVQAMIDIDTEGRAFAESLATALGISP